MARLHDLVEGLLDPRAPLLHVVRDTGEPGRADSSAGGRADSSAASGAHAAAGSAPVAPGPVVVMIHGIASSSTTFTYVMPLVEPTHRVIAIDLLGFGASPRPEHAEYTLEEHVAAVAHTIRSLHLREPFILVGHSLGCLIATRYAATHGTHLAKLVLVSPPVYLSPSEIGDPFTRLKMTGYLQAYQYLRENKEFTLAHAALVSRLLPIEHVMEITEENWTPFVKSLEHCIESQTVVSDLARVDHPVEVVYGRFDEFLVPENVAIIGRMRGVTTRLVNASDHVIRKPMARVVAKAINAPT